MNVTDLRAHLSDWLLRVREGEEVLVTERGIPVARLIGLETTQTLERLTDLGHITRPASTTRPTATGRPRPRPKRPIAEIISEQRR